MVLTDAKKDSEKEKFLHDNLFVHWNKVKCTVVWGVLLTAIAFVATIMIASELNYESSTNKFEGNIERDTDETIMYHTNYVTHFDQGYVWMGLLLVFPPTDIAIGVHIMNIERITSTTATILGSTLILRSLIVTLLIYVAIRTLRGYEKSKKKGYITRNSGYYSDVEEYYYIKQWGLTFAY